jgi:hypothetical protein
MYWSQWNHYSQGRTETLIPPECLACLGQDCSSEFQSRLFHSKWSVITKGFVPRLVEKRFGGKSLKDDLDYRRHHLKPRSFEVEFSAGFSQRTDVLLFHAVVGFGFSLLFAAKLNYSVDIPRFSTRLWR